MTSVHPAGFGKQRSPLVATFISFIHSANIWQAPIISCKEFIIHIGMEIMQINSFNKMCH